MRILGIDGITAPSPSLIAAHVADAFARADAERSRELDVLLGRAPAPVSPLGPPPVPVRAPTCPACTHAVHRPVLCRQCSRPTRYTDGLCRRHRPRSPRPAEPRILSVDRYPPSFLARPVVILSTNPHPPGSQPARQFQLLERSATVGAFLAAGGRERYIDAACFRGIMKLGGAR